VNTFFLRSKHINDYIHGLPGDNDIDAALLRWSPVPGMEDTYARPAPAKAAAVEAVADVAVISRAPSFTEKAAAIFQGKSVSDILTGTTTPGGTATTPAQTPPASGSNTPTRAPPAPSPGRACRILLATSSNAL